MCSLETDEQEPVDAQSQAHRSCTQILSVWLGKRRREEVVKELSIPPLHVCQLSHQAPAGMTAHSEIATNDGGLLVLVVCDAQNDGRALRCNRRCNLSNAPT